MRRWCYQATNFSHPAHAVVFASLSGVAEALTNSTDLDFPLRLPSAIAKHTESTSGCNDKPNDGKKLGRNDQANRRRRHQTTSIVLRDIGQVAQETKDKNRKPLPHFRLRGASDS